MKVYGGISIEQVLQAVNGRLPRTAEIVMVTGKVSGIEGNEAAIARHLFRESLRILVDDWIDSARTDDGEQPWQRQVRLRPLLQDYAERNPPLLQFGADGVPFGIAWPRNFDVRRKTFPLARAVESALLAQLDTQYSDAQFARKLFCLALDAAIHFFLQLLDSPDRTRLFRCDGCQVYFMRSRSPKKDALISRGAYCPDCKEGGKDRVRRTEDSRKRRNEEMIRRAADAWVQWKSDRRHGERAVWVAQRLNAKLPSSSNPIAKNWVTLHASEIESEVERRARAES